MGGFGAVCAIIGVLMMAYTNVMPSALPGMDTVMLDALNQKTNMMIGGAAFFVGGLALCGADAVRNAISSLRVLLPPPPGTHAAPPPAAPSSPSEDQIPISAAARAEAAAARPAPSARRTSDRVGTAIAAGMFVALLGGIVLYVFQGVFQGPSESGQTTASSARAGQFADDGPPGSDWTVKTENGATTIFAPARDGAEQIAFVKCKFNGVIDAGIDWGAPPSSPPPEQSSVGITMADEKAPATIVMRSSSSSPSIWFVDRSSAPRFALSFLSGKPFSITPDAAMKPAVQAGFTPRSVIDRLPELRAACGV